MKKPISDEDIIKLSRKYGIINASLLSNKLKRNYRLIKKKLDNMTERGLLFKTELRANPLNTASKLYYKYELNENKIETKNTTKREGETATTLPEGN